jgi:hypothetical protein
MVGSYRTFKATDITADGFVSGEIRATNNVVSSSQQIIDYNTFAVTSSANTFYGNQTISGSVNVSGGLDVNGGARFQNEIYLKHDPYANPVEGYTAIGSSGDSVFFIPSSTASFVFNVSNVTGQSTYTLPDVDGTLALIDSFGDLNIPNGNLYIGTSGKGIDFSTNVNDGIGLTAELLNDYEEGTWTPSVVFVGTPGTVNYVNRTGRYTKIGRVVHTEYSMTGVSITGSVGYITITGLPFTINSSVGGYQPFPVYGPDFLAFPSSSVVYQQGGTGDTKIFPQAITNSGFYSDFTNSNINAGGTFTVSALYTYST